MSRAELMGEIARLRKKNTDLNHRANSVEGPLYGRIFKAENAARMYEAMWQRDGRRYGRAFDECKRIFSELRRLYGYPDKGHSYMDQNAGAGEPFNDEGRIYANLFSEDGRKTCEGPIKSFRILDEVRRAVDELVTLRVAQGIEARRAETPLGGSVEDESPVAAGDAPK